MATNDYGRIVDFDKNDTRNAKRTAAKMQKRQLRVSNKGAVEFNKQSKADLKAGKSKTQLKVTSSTVRKAKTNSPTKPSMPVKTGVKNKMKAQGAKTMKSATSGYNRRGKK
jgi:uncharacterized protein YecE (DUF72 family)